MDKYKILFIDDEEELVTTLVERLEYRGMEADFALNGSDAVEMMRKNTYDVVVLDLKMPVMSGTEVMKIIEKEHPRLPVLLITGHGSLGEEHDEKPEGAFDYLEKPIDLEDLIAKMKEAIRSVNAQ
ncbi:response regulator [bacterium]|nr:response regulator [bacterium]